MLPDGEPAAVWAAEVALLQPAVRHDRAALERLLAPEFREIGRSGRMWSRGEMIEALLAAPAPEPASVSADLSERVAVSLCPGLVLITYRLVIEGRTSRRSSIWRTGAGGSSPSGPHPGPELVFHQGTRVP